MERFRSEATVICLKSLLCYKASAVLKPTRHGLLDHTAVPELEVKGGWSGVTATGGVGEL